MTFPQQPEPYDVKTASRYRLLTLTLIEAAKRGDLEELTSLFTQREETLSELEAIPNLGQKAGQLLLEAHNLNEHLVTALTQVQGEVGADLAKLYRDVRGAKGYAKGAFDPLSKSYKTLDQAG